MTLSDDIYSGLTGQTGFAARFSTRLYPLHFPSGVTFPCVTFQRITTGYGQSASRAVVEQRPRYQFSLWDDDYEGSETSTDVLIAALLALVGSSITINELTIDQRLDADFQPGTGLYMTVVEASIVHA